MWDFTHDGRVLTICWRWNGDGTKSRFPTFPNGLQLSLQKAWLILDAKYRSHHNAPVCWDLCFYLIRQAPVPMVRSANGTGEPALEEVWYQACPP